MSDVLEADDAYTGGEHSHGVVALALAVGDILGLDGRDRRNLEFGALLHDVGKIRVADEIINKPGKLTEDEWELMRRHPVDGQEMLERVGGVLAEVGLIVRHHHERWDGRGYPDGIGGHTIPLGAHHLHLRRLQRDDHPPFLPASDVGAGRDRRAAQLLGLAVRPGRRRGAVPVIASRPAKVPARALIELSA